MLLYRRTNTIVAWLLIGILPGCGVSSYFGKAGSSSDPLELTCTSRVLDYGTKSSAWPRGTASDVKLIPGTTRPAIAFSDSGALALKFTYWTGSEYITEVVSGDYNATNIRLVFLSTGIPWIIWSSGATLVKAAVRSAGVSSSGTWAAGVIDSGSTINAVEVAVSPRDQIGVLYLTDTAVGGRPRFVHCDTCTSATSFRSMTASTYIEDNNVTAAQYNVGISWCKVSSSTYYPAVAYALAANTKFAICQQSSLSSCSATANWTIQSVVASASTSVKLYLDPTVTGDVPKVIVQDGTAMIPYKMGATACTAAPAAFSAGAGLGGAASGTKSVNILKDQNGKFHVVANESTTSMRYYNSQSTDFVGAWNGAGTLQTATIGGAIWGGADIDTSSGGLYASYGITSGNADLMLAKVKDYTVASDSASLIVNRSQFDVTGNIQLSDTPKRNISAASTSSGIPAVAYVDYSSSASRLKYAIRNSSSSSSTWTQCLVPDTGFPQTPSLAFDANDQPWISYFDTTYAKFFLATNYSADCSGFWTTYEFPETPGGAQAAYPASNDTAIAKYGDGTSILMAVVDTNAATRGVYAALLTPSTSSWSSVATVGTLGASGGSTIDMDTDATGNGVLLYNDITVAKAQYSTTANGTSWSTAAAISYLNQGVGANIRIHPVTGYPTATYFDRANNSIYYNVCASAPSACASGGWSPQIIDAMAGVSGLTNRYEALLSPSLVFTSGNTPYVVYPRGRNSDGNLIALGIGSTSNVSSTMAYGVNSNFGDAPAFNYGVAGWGASATWNAAGAITTFHLGAGDWLYATSCGD